MKNYNPSCIRVVGRMVKLGAVLYFQTPIRDKKLIRELKSECEKHGFTISPQIVSRIRFYTIQIMLTNYCFGLLRGKSPSSRENLMAMYFGAFTPIADDVMDATGRTFGELVANANNGSAEEVLFGYLYEKIKPLFTEFPTFAKYFQVAHEAQDESLVQIGSTLVNEDVLREITFKKGGYYTLLNRSMMFNPLKPGEENTVLILGRLFQLLNDLFDTHKDYHSRVQTLVTRFPNYFELESQFNDQVSLFKQQYFELDYPKKNVLESSIIWALVIARGWIALKQFQKLQGGNELLRIGQHTRKELIVDMEKPVNMLRSILYACRFYKQ